MIALSSTRIIRSALNVDYFTNSAVNDHGVGGLIMVITVTPAGCYDGIIHVHVLDECVGAAAGHVHTYMQKVYI